MINDRERQNEIMAGARIAFRISPVLLPIQGGQGHRYHLRIFLPYKGGEVAKLSLANI